MGVRGGSVCNVTSRRVSQGFYNQPGGESPFKLKTHCNIKDPQGYSIHWLPLMGVIYISMGLFKVSSCQNDFLRPFQVIFKNNAFSIISRPAHAASPRSPSARTMKSHRLTIKSAIYRPGPFLLVSALLTCSIIAHNLIWTGKWPGGTSKAGEEGRQEEEGGGGGWRWRDWITWS